jgi:Calcineurin-like phosphoesterase
MAEFTSLILRFRDLSTPPGGTITEHRRIIEREKYVWWGWWHKQGETVPEEAFRAILDSIEKSGPFEIFLFDTGQYQLRRAKLAGIVWNNQLRLFATPERDKTPDYYGDSHYLAWFKLVDIEGETVPESELHRWSYVRVTELFDTKKSVFEAFYNKQVSSFTELRNQDRTIWFIRPKQAADPVYEIHVYDRSKTAPSNFPDQIVQAHTENLLWISDPHFSTDHHDFPQDPDLTRTNLSETIRRDLETLEITSVGGLLISGDLTWRATRPEFEWAAKFIHDVASWSKLTPSQILVCPGNHDLAFTAQPWVKGERATQVGEPAAAEYKRFYEQLYEVKPTEYMSCGRRMWLPDGQTVDIVSLNTSVLQQIPDAFQGQGFVGDPQLVQAAEAMMWSQDHSRSRAYRICMLHHHVLPILHRSHPEIGKAASVVHDAGALMRWLVENEVDLVLHGHMHLGAVVKHSRALDYPAQSRWHEVTIAALGSSGVIASHRPNEQNGYGLITFKRDGVEVTVRKISADNAIPLGQRTVFSVMLPYGTTHEAKASHHRSG